MQQEDFPNSSRGEGESDAFPILRDPRRRAAFQCRLIAWYARHARTFPWRQTRDPYAVWVSEIMLQQTQTATVEPLFRRFLERFPNVAALAAADQDEVLRYWEGLGYYRRAKALHAAAQRIVHEYGGQIPDDRDALLCLPGIGPYTAGAILSFAFDRSAPILEANSRRVLRRIFADRTGSYAVRDSRLWDWAARLVPQRHPGPYNQALMELGSLVCQPQKPRCEVCPVRDYCNAYLTGIQDEVPVTQTAPAITPVHELAIAVQHRQRVLLLRRVETGRWAGLWDFPRLELAATSIPTDPSLLQISDADAISASLKQSLGISVRMRTIFLRFRHAVTRYRISVHCILAQACSNRRKPPPVRPNPAEWSAWAWLEPQSLSAVPLSSPGRRIAAALLSHWPTHEGPPP